MFYSVYELFVEGGCILCGCSGRFVVEVDVFVGLFRGFLVVESVQCVPVVCMFCLWSQFCSNLFFHRFVLWSLMHSETSSFSCFRFWVVGFCSTQVISCLDEVSD